MISLNTLAIAELRQPFWLLLVLVPFISVIFSVISRQYSLPVRYFDTSMKYWYLNHDVLATRQYLFLFIIDLIFWGALSVALAGPQYPYQISQTINTNNTDATIILLDNSASMNATDISPSRLKRSVNEIRLLVDSLAPDKSLGLILFSGKPHLLFPPTNDHVVINYYLDMIKADMLPYAGTGYKALLDYTEKFIQTISGNQSTSVILISDGDIGQDQLNDILQSVSTKHTISTLSTGRINNAAVPSLSKKSLWLVHQGNNVVSNRNDIFLKQIAGKTGGKFEVLSDSKVKLIGLYESIMQSAHTTRSGSQYINWIQLFPVFLLIAAVVFFVRTILLSR